MYEFEHRWSELSKLNQSELADEVEWYPPENRNDLKRLSRFATYKVFDNRGLLRRFLEDNEIYIWTEDYTHGYVRGYSHKRVWDGHLELQLKDETTGERKVVSVDDIFSMVVESYYYQSSEIK